MLRWCAYCQEFQGEVAPLNRFTTTHGLCAACQAKGMDLLDAEIGHSHRLREIQGALYQAGKTGDINAAADIVRLALTSGLRPVDILLGVVTPLLHQIGDDWESGLVTIAEEQRFSGFCERVFTLVQLEVHAAPAVPVARPSLVFLMNARGNHHTLGIRTVGLMLESKGIETRVLDPPVSASTLIQMTAESGPKAILLSLALAGHKAFVSEMVLRIRAIAHRPPLLIVGGNAIKHNLVRPIAGAIFLESVSGLAGMILALD